MIATEVQGEIVCHPNDIGQWPQAEYGPLLDLANAGRLGHYERTWLTCHPHSQCEDMPLEVCDRDA